MLSQETGRPTCSSLLSIVNECVRYLSIRERTMTFVPVSERSAVPDGKAKSQTTGPANSGKQGHRRFPPRDAQRRDADSPSLSAPQSWRLPLPLNHHSFTGFMQGICAQTRRLHQLYAYRHTLEPSYVVIVSNKREVTPIQAGMSISKLNRTTGETDPVRRIVLGNDVSDP